MIQSFKYQKKKKKLRFNGKDFFRVSVRNALHHYEWLKDDLLPPEELEEKDRSSGHLLNFQVCFLFSSAVFSLFK